jgi:hypothetical protein
MLKSFITFFLLLGAVSISQADDKTPYQFAALNSDGVMAWENEYNSGAEENTFSHTAVQDDGRDCSALKYDVTLFTPCEGEDSARLWRQTKIMFVAGFGVAGFIALLPEDISKWDKSEYQRGDLIKNWYENVKAGPVWDNDTWYINYIGHPYFGSVYYMASRKSGYNQWNSFVYATLMSTFYWEYGLEAFAEVPSLQDLFVTPIGGWIWGEWAYHKEKAIIANGGQAMGSEFWGGVALFFLDPVGKLDSWCCVSKKVEVTAFNIAHWPAQQNSLDINPGKDYWGLNFALQF